MQKYVYIHFYYAQPHMLGASPSAVDVHHKALYQAMYHHNHPAFSSADHHSVFNKTPPLYAQHKWVHASGNFLQPQVTTVHVCAPF